MAMMSIPEQLTFTTFRIATDQGHGTGFVYSHGPKSGQRREFLVTNRHVVEGTQEGELTFTEVNEASGTDSPDIGRTAIVPVQDEAWQWYFHPSGDIDIAVMPFGSIAEHVSNAGHPPYYTGVTGQWLAGDQELQQLDVLEEVIFVGYPELAYDQRNNLPVFRRGTAATFPWIHYDGKPVFLIDASVFPGSSGSPVFVYKLPPWRNKYGQLMGEEQLLFLGVLSAAQYRNSTGVVVPDAGQPPRQGVIAEEMIDLGVVLKAQCVLETIGEIERN